MAPRRWSGRMSTQKKTLINAERRKERRGNAELAITIRTHLCSASLRVLRAYALVGIAILAAAQTRLSPR